jgi:hypothetical protein
MSVTAQRPEPVEPIPLQDPLEISILASTDAFTPGIPLQNPNGHSVLLTKIFGKVVEFSNIFKRAASKPDFASGGGGGGGGGAYSGASPGILQVEGAGRGGPSGGGLQKDYELSVLDASLRSWFSTLPDSVKAPPLDLSSVRSNNIAPDWNICYLHIFYHACLILLHRPKMMQTLKDSPASVHFSHSFTACQSSSVHIATVIEKVAAVNPGFCYFTPFVSFCIFQAGLIHVLAGQVCADPAMIAAAERHAELHVRVLAGIAKFWFMAERLHMVLKNLVESSRRGGFRSSQSPAWMLLEEKMNEGMVVSERGLSSLNVNLQQQQQVQQQSQQSQFAQQQAPFAQQQQQQLGQQLLQQQFLSQQQQHQQQHQQQQQQQQHQHQYPYSYY